jgi:hypothetical protein
MLCCITQSNENPALINSSLPPTQRSTSAVSTTTTNFVNPVVTEGEGQGQGYLLTLTLILKYVQNRRFKQFFSAFALSFYFTVGSQLKISVVS